MSYANDLESKKRTALKINQAYFIVAFISSFLGVYFYAIALIEAKYSIFLHLQPFRTGRALSFFETTLFVALFSFELFALLLGVSVILWRFYSKTMSKGHRYAAWLIPLSVISLYFILVTIKFQVLRYFNDGLSMMLVRQLGGGDVWSALHYVAHELAQLLPTILSGVFILAGAIFFLIRFGSRVIDYFITIKGIRFWLTLKYIIIFNSLIFIAAFVVAYTLPQLDKSLGYSLAHQVYLMPWRFITDFDRDGYGMIPRPIDHAPFDLTRHPYALEILDNGIDENGIGGDLEQNIWSKLHHQWVPDQLEKRNVLLIVLETARADLFQAKYHNQWVMPVLRSLADQSLTMVAHTAFTAPAIVSILNGVVSPSESSPSLIDRFKQLDYRTGIFSAQNETFGQQFSATGMSHVDTFFDARSVSRDKRMFVSSSAIALTIPSEEVLSHFEEWISSNVDSPRPFFVYMNLQELHYPYSYANIPTPLIDKPIPRYSISENETEWLRSSYYNAARVIDSSIAKLVNMLKQKNLFDNTVILIVGDHGEELFDSGSLGHGTNITYEQNSTIGVLINSPWMPDKHIPIGLSEVPVLIHNALTKKTEYLLPLSSSVMTFLGVEKPLQIGFFSKKGLTKYDFRLNKWTRQLAYGAKEQKAASEIPIIHQWESYLLSLDAQKG